MVGENKKNMQHNVSKVHFAKDTAFYIIESTIYHVGDAVVLLGGAVKRLSSDNGDILKGKN